MVTFLTNDKLFFFSQINGEDVSAASHEHVVELIRSSGALVSMTVVSLAAGQSGQPHSSSVNDSYS